MRSCRALLVVQMCVVYSLTKLVFTLHSNSTMNCLPQSPSPTCLEKNPSDPRRPRVTLQPNPDVLKMLLTEQTTLVRTSITCIFLTFGSPLAYLGSEFAFEIGSGLLTEVRRLQSLLAERDKAIQDMKEEKDDLEKSVESLRTALRQQEQSAGMAEVF